MTAAQMAVTRRVILHSRLDQIWVTLQVSRDVEIYSLALFNTITVVIYLLT